MANRRKRYAALVLALVLALGALAGCQSADSQTGDEQAGAPEGVSPGQPLATAYAADKVFSLNYSPESSLNPITTTSTLNLTFGSLMYESLFEVDENFICQPRLATEYSSEDGVTWLIRVDTGILMHDGSTLTAKDVAYSIQRAQRTTLYSARLANIYGISALDDEMVMITLGYANRQFPSLLNIPVIKSGTLNDAVPVGTGPYVLNPDHMRLEKFEGYRDADKLPVDVIYLREYPEAENTIQAYEDSIIDLVVNDPTGLSNLGYGSTNEIRKVNTTSMHFIGFNMDAEFVKFSNYRYAIGFAVDRAHIVQELMDGYGQAAVLPVSPSSPLYNTGLANKYNKYGMDNCLAAFAAANVKDHDDDGKLEYVVTGINLEIEVDFIVNNESAVKVAAAREIAEALTEIGVTVKLRELAWDDYVKALQDGNFDMYYGEVRLTADFDLTSMLTEDGALNYGNIQDPHYQELLTNYLTAGDENRQAQADELWKYILDTTPFLTIGFESQEVLTHRGVVSGMKPTQYDIFHNFTDWTIDLNV
jgi:peptide/nickel transport system substrate-binding protein